MGQVLKEYYQKAIELGSMKAQMRLTLLTKMSSIKAEEEPDTPEMIEKFKDAIKEIEKEFSI